jgi:hypothetical protein
VRNVRYKDLEPGKSIKGAHWGGRTEAEKVNQEAIDRATAASVTPARWSRPAPDGYESQDSPQA